MKTVNMHEAKTQLSKLVDQAVKGEPFVIAKAGKPLVKVVMIKEDTPKRVGFLDGAYDIPADFDAMGAGDIEDMFDGAFEGELRTTSTT